MFYIEEIKIEDAAGLLSACGLTMPRNVDYTAGVFCMESGFGGDGRSVGCDSGGDGNDRRGAGGARLVACGSLKADMIQGVAVDPAFQGEDLTGKLMTRLIAEGRERGFDSLYLFTKAEKAVQFTGLGFRLAAKARPYAALLEWGSESVRGYMENLAAIRRNAEEASGRSDEEVCRKEKDGCAGSLRKRKGGTARGQSGTARAREGAGALRRQGTGVLVMNGNPFTRGHRYLAEYAAARKSHVYVLVVEEDLSLFSFADRLAMVKRGLSDLANVTVITGGRYAVSALTFPSYFTQEENLARAHAAMDCELFAGCIAPPLGADERFVGTEPVSRVTAVYNEVLKERLPKRGVRVTEIPRLTDGGDADRGAGEKDDQPVSASRVRAALERLYAREGSLAGLRKAAGLCEAAGKEAFGTETAGKTACKEAACSETAGDTENGEAEAALADLKKLLPDSSLEYILQRDVLKRLESRLRNQAGEEK